MVKPFEFWVELFIAIILLFLFPLLYFSLKQDLLTQSIVRRETVKLVNEVRYKGYLTRERYDNYLNSLGRYKGLYKVSIEHRQRIYEPEYRLRTPEEIKTEHEKTFQDSNYYTYREVISEPPIISELPFYDEGLNTETNESILADSTRTPPKPNHIHNEECYHGLQHKHTGNPASGGGCYGNPVTQTFLCGGTNFYNSIMIRWACNKCTFATSVIIGHIPSIDHYGFFGLCSGTLNMVDGYEEKRCRDCGNIVPNIASSCNNINTRTLYSLICNKTEGLYYDGDIIVNPICSEKIINLSPTHPVQKVKKGDPLILTATVTYLDGSTEIILCETTFITNTVVENEDVTITYWYMLGGIHKLIERTIQVTVISGVLHCTSGHSYHVDKSGGDPGCPYCRSWLRSLSIVLPDNNNITIFQGTTLQENGVKLLATYLDGQIEYVIDGYIDNLDNTYIGAQHVTIGYKGFYVSFTVTTIPKKIICSICLQNYDLYHNFNPGCPYCQSYYPIFTNQIMHYEYSKYTKEILDHLYLERGNYYFNYNDYFSITVKRNSKSLGGVFYNHFFTRNINDFYLEYGGYIRDEVR